MEAILKAVTLSNIYGWRLSLKLSHYLTFSNMVYHLVLKYTAEALPKFSVEPLSQNKKSNKMRPRHWIGTKSRKLLQRLAKTKIFTYRMHCRKRVRLLAPRTHERPCVNSVKKNKQRKQQTTS